MIKIDCFDISGLTEQEYFRLYRLATGQRRLQADRYQRQEDKIRCVCADALLRNALQRSDYTVETNQHGKPHLIDVEGFQYNISHSGPWVVIAYGNTPVGVDVQQPRSQGLAGIAQRFFTPDEQTYVKTHGEGFFRIWTAKESYLKYLGTGLSQSLKGFSVLEDLGVNFYFERLRAAHLALCTEEGEYMLQILEKI